VTGIQDPDRPGTRLLPDNDPGSDYPDCQATPNRTGPESGNADRCRKNENTGTNANTDTMVIDILFYDTIVYEY
jgi:hypothetical protein